MFEGREKQAVIDSKNLILLEDQIKLEALAAKKCGIYAEHFQNPELKSFAQQLAAHHRDNLAGLSGYLNTLK